MNRKEAAAAAQRLQAAGHAHEPHESGQRATCQVTFWGASRNAVICRKMFQRSSQSCFPESLEVFQNSDLAGVMKESEGLVAGEADDDEARERVSKCRKHAQSLSTLLISTVGFRILHNPARILAADMERYTVPCIYCRGRRQRGMV